MLLYIDNNSRSTAHKLLQHIRDILDHMGLHQASSGIYDKWIYLIVIALQSFLAMFVLSRLSNFILKRILQHRKGAFWSNLYQSQFIIRLLKSKSFVVKMFNTIYYIANIHFANVFYLCLDTKQMKCRG